MSIYPSPDKLDQAESKYALVILAAKRARQIKDGAKRLTGSTSPNPLTVALEEIAAAAIVARVTEDPNTAALVKARVPTYEEIIGAGPVVMLDVETDASGRDNTVLRVVETIGDDEDTDNDDGEEVVPVDEFVQDAPDLISTDDDEDDRYDNPIEEDEE